MFKKSLVLALCTAVLITAFVGAGVPTNTANNTKVNTVAQPLIANTENSVVYDMSTNKINEMRGIWVATVTNVDMPSKMNEEAFKGWASAVCQNASDRKFNSVFFQVKPTADTLYKSNLAPWSKYVTGAAQGTNPNYDPLAIMIEAAHSRGLELHAWINPYRVTMPNEGLSSLAANNPAILNPSWVAHYNKQYYLNPGIPEVRQYLIDCVAELTTNYDIDGIHMDDYFYPYPAQGLSFPDSAQYSRYGGGFASIGDWRRSNVNLLVAGIHRKITEIKPYIPFGISPFGIWRNKKTDASGSDTAGLQNYDALYADTRRWIKDGSVDYLAPQIYWSRISTVANFNVLIDWWNEEALKYAVNHPVHLFIGIADYKVGTNNDAAWQKYGTELMGQITEIRQKEALSGQIHFSYKNVINNPLTYFDYIKNNLYQNISLPPSYYWKDETVAAPPKSVSTSSGESGINVSVISNAGDNTVRKYVIYRTTGTSAPTGGFDNSHIVGVTYKNGDVTTFVDKTAQKGISYKYFVASVSPAGVENYAMTESGALSY